MQIAILGSGYVGLVSSACLAELGHVVTCVDIDAGKIARLKAGDIPIFEPGLEEMIAGNVIAGRLRFSTEIEPAIAHADVIFIAVGTPSRNTNGDVDLSFVHAAACTIGKSMQGFTVVVNKSTAPVGTGDEIERILSSMNKDHGFAVVSNPEFLREGVAIADFMHPDRVVIGTQNARARAIMEAVYAPLGSSVPILYVSRRTSELVKYASNAFLALKISYINEIADLCETLGADIIDVSRGMGLDHRIGTPFLNAGPGYGGSCFPKDTLALIKSAREQDSPVSLIETMVSSNDKRKRAMAHKVVAACGGSVRDKIIAILGLTFKPDTDDMRESPSIAIIRTLQAEGARISAYDPKGMESASRILDEIDYGDSAYAAAQGADAVVLVTEWKEFRALDFTRLGTCMKNKILVDLRNMYQAEDITSYGFRYCSIGRPATSNSAVMMEAAE